MGEGGHKDHEGHTEGSGCVVNRLSVFDYDDEDIGEGSGESNEQLSDNVWAPPVFEDSIEEDEYDAHSETSFVDLKVVENNPKNLIGSSTNEESMAHLPSEEELEEVGKNLSTSLKKTIIPENATEKQEYEAKNPDLYFEENPVLNEEHEVRDGLRSKKEDKHSGTCDTGRLEKITIM